MDSPFASRVEGSDRVLGEARRFFQFDDVIDDDVTMGDSKDSKGSKTKESKGGMLHNLPSYAFFSCTKDHSKYAFSCATFPAR